MPSLRRCSRPTSMMRASRRWLGNATGQNNQFVVRPPSRLRENSLPDFRMKYGAPAFQPIDQSSADVDRLIRERMQWTVDPKLFSPEMSAEIPFFHGFIPVNKPAGVTSHDCVNFVRRVLRTRRIGHGGTLDVGCRGVLPIAVGAATKFIQYLETKKTYVARIRFGLQTTTDDLDGTIIKAQPVPWLTRKHVEEVIPQFLGDITQVVPLYSAKRIKGKRLYTLARQGVTADQINLPETKVHISTIKILGFKEGDFPEIDVQVECGGGTYIRSLAREMGLAILGPAPPQLSKHDASGPSPATIKGPPALGTMTDLCRTHCAGFALSQTITPDDWKQYALACISTSDAEVDVSLAYSALPAANHGKQKPVLPPDTAFRHLPWIFLDEERGIQWRNYGGAEVEISSQVIPKEFQIKSQRVRVYAKAKSHFGDFLGLGDMEDIKLKRNGESSFKFKLTSVKAVHAAAVIEPVAQRKKRALEEYKARRRDPTF